MSDQATAGWQPSLLDSGEIEFDVHFSGATRRELADGAWLDHMPSWVRGADELFATLLDTVAWESRTIRMYDRERSSRGWWPAGGSTRTGCPCR